MNLDKQAGLVLDCLMRNGAEGDLVVEEGRTLSLKARDGELEEHKVSSSRVFGLRAIKHHRVGIAYSEAADEEALLAMVEQALANTAFATMEPDETIQPATGNLVTDDALLCPRDATPIEDKIRFSLAMERGLAARDKVKNVPHNSVQDVTAEQHVFTSAGLGAASKQRTCIAIAYALMEEGEANVLDGTGRASRRFDDLDHEAIVEEAHTRCLGLLHGKPIAGKHYDVTFDVECQPALFDAFAMMFSAQAAKDGVNPMRGKVGERIADSRLSVSDVPLLSEGFGYALFDAEGTPTRETTLIDQGRLATLAHNSATAAHFGLATTGHARRTARSRLGVGLHQVQIGPGDTAPNTLLAGEYLEITDLAGLHSGTNPVSGQFSLGAAGYLCRDGKRGQPVRNVTVAGNFYDMLKKIAAIGDELFWNLQRSARMPRIRFADVAIAA